MISIPATGPEILKGIQPFRDELERVRPENPGPFFCLHCGLEFHNEEDDREDLAICPRCGCEVQG